MNRPSFDVLTKPWIPVIRMDRSHDELGILPCLKQAPELREIRDPAPIVEFGLYRLLVAFVLDALILAGMRPEHHLDLQAIIAEGRFDADTIENYVKHCGDVFDLFHPDQPFLQTKIDNVNPKPISAMFPASPSGTNVSLWHHRREEDLTVTDREAARLLTTIAPFMTAGGAGLSPSINGSPPIYALPVGGNLFETIVLNIPTRNDDSGDGTTAWRSKRMPGQDRSQATTTEALTWRPRRIQLVPESDAANAIYVRKMKFEKGDSTRLVWTDSSLAYRYASDKRTPVRMWENRPLWRDAGPLLLLNKSQHGRGEKKVEFTRPDNVENAFHLVDAERPLVIQIYAMRTNMKMKVFEWAKATLFVPSRLGLSTRLGYIVQDELDRAEKAAWFLHTGIKKLYPREGAGNKNALGEVADRCGRAYWQRLEHGFYPLMSGFAALDPESAPDNPAVITTTAKSWREAIRNIALEQFETAAEDMDSDSDALERQVNARGWLHHMLKEALS